MARLLEAAGITTILVTHDQAEALSFADQLAVMRGGSLVQSGTPTELYHHPDDENTAHFLGSHHFASAIIGRSCRMCSGTLAAGVTLAKTRSANLPAGAVTTL